MTGLPQLLPYKRVDRAARTSFASPQMPTVAFFNGVMVRINVRDHPPPHCHVFYSGHKAVFSIDPVLLTHGQLPPAQRADVLAWMTRHQAELRQAWMDCQAQQIATSIPYP